MIILHWVASQWGRVGRVNCLGAAEPKSHGGCFQFTHPEVVSCAQNPENPRQSLQVDPAISFVLNVRWAGCLTDTVHIFAFLTCSGPGMTLSFQAWALTRRKMLDKFCLP